MSLVIGGIENMVIGPSFQNGGFTFACELGLHTHGFFNRGYTITKLDAAYLHENGADRVSAGMTLRTPQKMDLVKGFAGGSARNFPSPQDAQSNGFLSTPGRGIIPFSKK